mgnify:FL=1
MNQYGESGVIKIMDKKNIIKNSKIMLIALMAITISSALFATCNAHNLTDEVTPSSIEPRQTYYFNVLNETCNVYVEYDGSLTIEYFIEFQNTGSTAIRYVDIGFPTGNYVLSSVNATITTGGGTTVHPVTDIDHAPKDILEHGVTADLDPYAIPGGSTETFYLIGINRHMLFEDSVDSTKASFEFVPTWFGVSSQIQNYNLTFYFPANELDGTQLKWHEKSWSEWKEPETGLKNFTDPLEQRLFYNWYYSSISQGPYQFGASFPKSWVASGVVQLNPMATLIVWIVLSVFGGITVLVSSIYLIVKYKKRKRMQYYPPVRKKPNPFQSVGCCCFIAVAAGLYFGIDFLYYVDFSSVIFIGSLVLIVAAFVFIAYFIARAIDKKRVKYKKPKLSIECVGVNKNLTVPEAAIIKNTPLGRVIFLILFGMMRKQLIELEETDPIKFKKTKKLFTENLRSMPEKERKIRDYELDIYEAITSTGKFNETLLKKAMVGMIKKTHKKMVGFDLKATKEYHDNMMVKAWNQIKNTKGDLKFDEIADQFAYTVLDDEFDEKSKDVYTGRRIYMPYWYYRPYHYWYMRPGGHSVGSGLGRVAGTPFSGGSGGFMGASQFANSIATGLQNISNNIATNVSSFFNSIVSKIGRASCRERVCHRV